MLWVLGEMCTHNVYVSMENWRKLSQNYYQILLLTHLSLASHKWDIGKTCRLRADAAEWGVWSGYSLFALSFKVSSKHAKDKN